MVKNEAKIVYQILNDVLDKNYLNAAMNIINVLENLEPIYDTCTGSIS